MDFDENNVVEEQQDGGEPVEIYSRKAIWWFTFFSPIIGGIMLAINLYNVGYKKAIANIAVFSILFYLATNVISLKLATYYQINNLKIDFKNIDTATQENFSKFGIILIALNVIGATVMTRLFFKRYFPDDDYYPKSITVPLVITFIIIFLSFMGAGI